MLLSTPKGLLKRERKGTDIVAVGDRVTVIDVGEARAGSNLVQPRRRYWRGWPATRGTPSRCWSPIRIRRCSSSRRRSRAAPRMLDRFLVLAESRDLPALIGVNKVDLLVGGAQSGFPEHRAHLSRDRPQRATGQGLHELRAELAGKITVMAGPSGVGKSSLVNALNPDLGLAVSTISERPVRASTRRPPPSSSGSDRIRTWPTHRGSGRWRCRVSRPRTCPSASRSSGNTRPLPLQRLHPHPRTRLRDPRGGWIEERSVSVDTRATFRSAAATRRSRGKTAPGCAAGWTTAGSRARR